MSNLILQKIVLACCVMFFYGYASAENSVIINGNPKVDITNLSPHQVIRNLISYAAAAPKVHLSLRDEIVISNKIGQLILRPHDDLVAVENKYKLSQIEILKKLKECYEKEEKPDKSLELLSCIYPDVNAIDSFLETFAHVDDKLFMTIDFAEQYIDEIIYASYCNMREKNINKKFSGSVVLSFIDSNSKDLLDVSYQATSNSILELIKKKRIVFHNNIDERRVLSVLGDNEADTAPAKLK